MKQLTLIFFFAVAALGLTSTTCQERPKDPHRPFGDTTNTNGGGGGKDVGGLKVRVVKLTDAGTPCNNAEVKMFLTKAAALAGTPHIVAQFTNSDGYTTFEWDPGQYYIVSTYTENPVIYTSDTTKIQGFQPTSSGPRGPQLVQIVKDVTRNVVDPVDIRK